VLPLRALLELRVDIGGHLRVGMADLAHDPHDVEVVRQQRDRHLRPSQRARTIVETPPAHASAGLG
jgi:hypothetical protein